MSRDAAIAAAEQHFTSGAYKRDLARRVAIPTESQNPERAADLKRYLDAEMVPSMQQLGFACEVLTHAKSRGPFLYGERIEDKSLPTVLGCLAAVFVLANVLTIPVVAGDRAAALSPGQMSVPSLVVAMVATQVAIKLGAKGRGQLVIDFADLDALDGVIARLRGSA